MPTYAVSLPRPLKRDLMGPARIGEVFMEMGIESGGGFPGGGKKGGFPLPFQEKEGGI